MTYWMPQSRNNEASSNELSQWLCNWFYLILSFSTRVPKMGKMSEVDA